MERDACKAVEVDSERYRQEIIMAEIDVELTLHLPFRNYWNGNS